MNRSLSIVFDLTLRSQSNTFGKKHKTKTYFVSIYVFRFQKLVQVIGSVRLFVPTKNYMLNQHPQCNNFSNSSPTHPYNVHIVATMSFKWVCEMPRDVCTLTLRNSKSTRQRFAPNVCESLSACLKPLKRRGIALKYILVVGGSGV